MNTIDEAVDFAIEKEGEMAAYYTQLAGIAETFGSREKFDELAKMEMHHKDLLEELDMKKVPEETEHSTPDLKISDYLKDIKFSPDIRYQDVLIMAMKAEEQSHRSYLSLAANFPKDSDIFHLFDFLAEQEAKHKYMIESEYEDNVLREDH